ncbi:hypothetical protein CEXT_762171 [Caerostris extrusa]|uniref:Uncharacterized protein n=1 Tax=Caerostris extrusa TaxID=172846 RepID=A0AAV4NWE9_CAEEX|nr:hypothetical protein CEXT_762171 [Caerostris extrusa]
MTKFYITKSKLPIPMHYTTTTMPKPSFLIPKRGRRTGKKPKFFLSCASPSTTLVHKFKCRPKGTSILLSKQCPYYPGKESALGEDNRDQPCRKMQRGSSFNAR